MSLIFYFVLSFADNSESNVNGTESSNAGFINDNVMTKLWRERKMQTTKTIKTNVRKREGRRKGKWKGR